MAILKTNKRQLIYIYSGTSIFGKKLLPYLSTSKKAVRVIDIDKEKISNTIWVEISKLVKKPFHKLFFKKKINHETNYNTDDWIKIIQNNPSMLMYPIMISDERALQIKKRVDLFSFFTPAGGNFSKNPRAIKYGNHSSI